MVDIYNRVRDATPLDFECETLKYDFTTTVESIYVVDMIGPDGWTGKVYTTHGSNAVIIPDPDDPSSDPEYGNSTYQIKDDDPVQLAEQLYDRVETCMGEFRDRICQRCVALSEES